MSFGSPLITLIYFFLAWDSENEDDREEASGRKEWFTKNERSKEQVKRASGD